MVRRWLILVGVVLLVGAVVPVAAAHQDLSPTKLDTPGTSQVVELPDASGEHAVALGTAFDPGSGQLVEGYAIFHHREGHDGGPGGGGSPGGADGGGDTSTCYTFLANGAGWTGTEPWVFNTTNADGLDGSALFGGLSRDLDKWEEPSGSEIFGSGSTTGVTLVADSGAPDGVNEVYFGDISSNGAIAVTIVWGVFSGPPPFRYLAEWDMVFDQVDFDWSLSGEAGKMDFENISTHEVGHAAGMGHPSDSCGEETMYRFAGTGETKKRDLNAGDIAGIRELY